jgi:hypothetical protein
MAKKQTNLDIRNHPLFDEEEGFFLHCANENFILAEEQARKIIDKAFKDINQLMRPFYANDKEGTNTWSKQGYSHSFASPDKKDRRRFHIRADVSIRVR